METNPAPEGKLTPQSPVTIPIRISLDPSSLVSSLAEQIATNAPAWQRTEFYLALFIIAAITTFSALGKIPASWAAAVLVIYGAANHYLENSRKDEHQTNLLNLVQTVVAALPAKPLALLALFCGLSFLFAGCQTRDTLYDRATGKKLAEFQSNRTHSHYQDGATVFDNETVDSSTPTLAMGHAVGHIVKKAGDAVTEVGLTYFSGGTTSALPVVVGKGAAFGSVLSNSSGIPVPVASTPVPLKTH